MANRIKLCAIARNEGAYLADWVFHHLHVGFDAIEVWLNGTDDTSVEVVEAILAVHPQVGFRVVDRLLQDSLARGRSFQHRAYARMARRAARQGFSHAAFLDLDEYWTPRDLATPVQAFVPEDDAVNVVSFPWCLDVPDRAREPFGAGVGPATLQLDPHVKSVVRLDDRVAQVRTHTARTTSGTRLLVDRPFPLVDERGQQWGSVVPPEHLVQSWDELPRAFVLHAVHRSQVEYVASLAKGLRQTGADHDLKTNRRGYVPGGAPPLRFEPPADALAAYRTARAAFHAAVGVGPLVRAAEQQVLARADALLARAVEDEQVMARLRGPLHGVEAPALDARHPGWDAHLEWYVDGVALDGGVLRVDGWAYGTGATGIELALRGGGHELPLAHAAVARPDVAGVRPGAPEDCGFRVEAAVGDVDLHEAVLVARVAGSRFWDARPLREVVARTSAPPVSRAGAPASARPARGTTG